MIKANELRIGNIVGFLMEDSVDEREEWYEPNIINVTDLVYLSNREIRHKDFPPDKQVKPDYIPLPITEEWLLKLGFIKGTDLFFLPIPNLSCEIHATFYRGGYVIELQNHLLPIVTEVEYVHQLQNIYYSLTNTEL